MAKKATGKIIRRRTTKAKVGSVPQELTVPLGATGTQFFNGLYNIRNADEYVSDLQGSKALSVYNKMFKSDGQVAMLVNSIKLPILSANWEVIEPGDSENPATDKEKEITKMVRDWLFYESKFSWTEFLGEATNFIHTGFYCFEKLYRRTSDGWIIIDALSPRLPSTIVEWFDEQGHLESVKQQIDSGKDAGTYLLPTHKLLYLIFNKMGGDYRGSSILRHAYKHWFFKSTLYNVQAVAIERMGVGVPKVSMPSGAGESARREAIEAAKNIRAHEKSFIIEPEGMKIDFMDMGGGKVLDPQVAIDHHNLEISKSVLAQFLELGISGAGSHALGDTMKDMFLGSIQWIANYLAEQIQETIIGDLVRFNFGEEYRYPKLVVSGIQPDKFDKISGALQKIGASGYVTADDTTENHVRDLLNLPPKEEVEEEPETEPEVVPETEDAGEGGSEGDDQENAGDAPPPKDSEMEDEEETEEPKLKANQGEFAQPKTPNGMEAPSEIFFWRPLRKTEERANWREINGRLDDSKEIVVRATRRARADAIEYLMPQMKAAFDSGDPKKINKIDLNDDFIKELATKSYNVLEDLYGYGIEQVQKEMQRVKRDAKVTAYNKRKPPYDPENVVDRFAASSAQFAERADEAIVNDARAQTTSAVRSGNFDTPAITDTMTSRSEAAVRKGVGYVTNEAFSYGRAQGAEMMDDEIDRAEYTSVMDTGTCGPCSELDGQQFKTDSPEYELYTPPLSTCEGGDQCRCQWIYISKFETEAEA